METPLPISRRKLLQTFFALVLVAVLGIGGWWRSRYISHPARWGETMGTSFSIKISGKVAQSDLKHIARCVDEALADVNRQMSTWDPDSEISRFNAATNAGPHAVSAGFAWVMAESIELARRTGGAFDPTLQPLLNLWGFGSQSAERKLPTPDEIETARQQTGWENLSLDASSNLWKSLPALQLDLGAIAKGYGVDRIARVLEESGLENWFVEIGGEVVAKGLNPDGEPWKIGIQYPTTNPMDERLHGIAHVTQGAVATSGDYRNYVRENGIDYSHILDPRTGYAIHSETASVTVLAPDCTIADGLATAFFVMGSEAGIALAESLPGVETMFLVRDENGQIIARFSSGFVQKTRYSAAH